MDEEYYMTKDEAYEAMQYGYKVTREYFSEDEFLYMENGIIYSEDGWEFDDWWVEIEPTINKSSDTPWAFYYG